MAALLLCWTGSVGRPDPPPTKSTPPPWQQELNAANLLEASLLASPGADPAQAAQRDARLTAVFEQLAARYPEQAAVQKAYGTRLWHQGQAAESILSLSRAAALDPKDADTADLIGSADVQLGRMPDAAAQWQHATAVAPEDPRYHFALANVLYLFRKELLHPPELPDENAVLVRALAEFQAAASLAPKDMRYAQAYAETFYIFAHPDWQQARSAWEAVRDLSGNNTDFANSHLARISLRLRRPEDARRYLALIHGAAFDGLKANLLSQAAKLPPAGP
jgi:tetratricopeptide (TPR) repeat protein